MTDDKNVSTTVSKKDISGSYDKRENTLNSEIVHIQGLIDNLISHKLTIEQANRLIEQLANAEQDRQKKVKYHQAIQSNIELLTVIFRAIADLEGIKFKYHKEIDDVITNKLSMIAVQIRKIEEKLTGSEEGVFSFFEKLNSVLNSSKKPEATVNAVSEELKKDKQYEL